MFSRKSKKSNKIASSFTDINGTTTPVIQSPKPSNRRFFPTLSLKTRVHPLQQPIYSSEANDDKLKLDMLKTLLKSIKENMKFLKEQNNKGLLRRATQPVLDDEVNTIKRYEEEINDIQNKILILQDKNGINRFSLFKVKPPTLTQDEQDLLDIKIENILHRYKKTPSIIPYVEPVRFLQEAPEHKPFNRVEFGFSNKLIPSIPFRPTGQRLTEKQLSELSDMPIPKPYPKGGRRKPTTKPVTKPATKPTKKPTKKPTTKKPATKKPTTKKPATKKPTTKKPITKKPTTKKPTTKKPTTKPTTKRTKKL
jgi:hypothetical protein